MFCIKDNKLLIAPIGSELSHNEWLLAEGLIESPNDMAELTRGVVSADGDVYFYVGFDFDVNEKAEKEFFEFLPELAEKLKLKPEARIFGGCIKQQSITLWPGKKSFGRINQFI